jgi:hypothetical protein
MRVCLYLAPEAVAHLADLLEDAAAADTYGRADLWRDLTRRLDDLAEAFPGQYRLHRRQAPKIT